MDSIKSAFYVSLKRPGATIFMSILIFIFCIIETQLLGILTRFILKFVSQGKADILKTIISFIQIVLESDNYLLTIVFVILAILVISIIISFVFSGYFFIINNIVEKKKKFRGEFFEGVKNYYKKFLTTTIKSMVIFVLVLLFLMVAIIPAIISTKAMIDGKVEIAFVAIVLDVITLFMLFFGFMFLRMYLFFWYPSIYSNRAAPFSIAKQSVDKYFWDVIEKFLTFDVVLILFQIVYLIVYAKSFGSGIEYIVIGIDWIFKTLFFISYVTYIFRSHKYYSENINITPKIKYNDFNNNQKRNQSSNHANNQYYNKNYNQNFNSNYKQNQEPKNDENRYQYGSDFYDEYKDYEDR